MPILFDQSAKLYGGIIDAKKNFKISNFLRNFKDLFSYQKLIQIPELITQ